MPEGVRDPVNHRTPEQKRKDAAKRWRTKPHVREANRKQKQARRDAIKAGIAKEGDGKDVHHVKPISKGGTNALSNLKAVSPGKNRSHTLGTSRLTQSRSQKLKKR